VEVIRAATESPAKALRRPDLGSFRQGSAGDASVLAMESGQFDYVDSTGEHMAGNRRLTVREVVLNGQLRG